MSDKKTDAQGVKLGMWLFIFTELMLFCGLFILYAAYYTRYKAMFVESGKELDLFFGTFNTVILLISSFTVAAAIAAIQRGIRRHALIFLSTTIFLGLLFLVNKYFEWTHKIAHGIYPGSPGLTDGPAGKNIFFSIYYLITGLHGLHILVGLILLVLSTVWVYRHKISTERYALLENAGLYWHLVDLIWIFIFPLFYLVL